MKNKTKIIVYSGLALVAGVVAYKYFKGAKVTAAGTSGNNGGGGTGIENEGGGGMLNFKTLADTIFNAVDGYGTDEATITSAFSKLKSDADMNNLIAAYGVRTASSGFGNIFVDDYNGGLFDTLKNELRSSEIATINTNLSKQGVAIKIS